MGRYHFLMDRYHATAHPLEKIKIGGIENAKSAHRDMTSHHYAATPVRERKNCQK